MPPRRKPGTCLCPCHNSGMTGALGPCGWCIDLHGRPAHNDGEATPASPAEAFEAGRNAGATVRLVGYGAGLIAVVAGVLGGYALRGDR